MRTPSHVHTHPSTHARTHAHTHTHTYTHTHRMREAALIAAADQGAEATDAWTEDDYERELLATPNDSKVCAWVRGCVGE